MSKNNVRKLREELLMSKAELARKAGVSALTIDRIEGGKSCRMDTKRKIILALGFKLADKEKVFDKTENLAKRADQEGDEEGGEAPVPDDEEATTEEA
jgi:DNA-binding XRE family transcriptional regulator